MRATRATTVLSSFLLSATLACGGGARDHREPPADTTAKPDVAGPTTTAPAASPLGNLGPLSSMLADKLDAPGPYDPPRQSPDFDATYAHTLARFLCRSWGIAMEYGHLMTAHPRRGSNIPIILLGRSAGADLPSGGVRGGFAAPYPTSR